MNIGVPSITPLTATNGIVGQAATETASIAYDGTLLPAGTASYAGISIDATKRYLKNSGKDKTPALVESGQGKFFNGTNQYINTGIIPNQAQGTLVTRFTYVTGQVSRCIIGSTGVSIWVNASGKIEALFGDAVITSTDVLVNGYSYHVSLSWNGLVATIKVDNITKATNTATTFTPTNVMYLGARNNAGTPDRYFNNVIDETYYYDVALSDSQIQSLYLYPEKVKAYNGAIVPDIGSEANCKLFLPLCENSSYISYVSNTIIPKTLENYFNNSVGFATTTGGSSGEVSVLTDLGSGNFKTEVTTVGTSNVSPFLQFNGTRPSTSSKLIYVEFNAVVTSGTMYITKYYNGATSILLPTPYLVVNGYNVIPVESVLNNARVCFLYADGTKLFNVTLSAINSQSGSSLPIINFTTAMHTSAAKLSYGAQCTAWKRDSLGVLLGMSNGLSFDGGVSVNPISSGYIPLPSEDWAIETIMYLDEINQRSKGNGTNTTGRMQISSDSVGWIEVLCGGSARKQPTTGYHHIAIQFNTTTKTFNAWYDGVLFGTNVNASAYGIPTLPYSIGGIVRTTTTWDNKTALVQGTTKIHKGTQYAKFNIDKAWAKAQKTIAKLP